MEILCKITKDLIKWLLENVNFSPIELNACLLSKTQLQSQNSTGANSTIVVCKPVKSWLCFHKKQTEKAAAAIRLK